MIMLLTFLAGFLAVGLMLFAAGAFHVGNNRAGTIAVCVVVAILFIGTRLERTETVVWDKAQRNDLIGDYRAYLARFPSGTNRDVAKSRYADKMTRLRAQHKKGTADGGRMGAVASALLLALEIGPDGPAAANNRLDVVMDRGTWSGTYKAEASDVRALIEKELSEFADRIGADLSVVRKRSNHVTILCRYSSSDYGMYAPSSGIGGTVPGLSLSVELEVYGAGESEAAVAVSLAATPEQKVFGGSGEARMATHVRSNLEGELKKALALK
jgi:hypothetical protein